jgi:hypothetical protein
MQPNCQQIRILQCLLSWSFAPFSLAVGSQPSAISFLFNIEKLAFRAKSEFNGFADKGTSCFGVLEYWSVGKNENPNLT